MRKFVMLIVLGCWSWGLVGQEDLMENVEWVVEPSLEYARIYPFHEGMARLKKFSNGSYSLINKENKKITPFIHYQWVLDFKEDLAGVVAEKSGFIDKTGKVVIPLIYDEVSSFSEGLAKVRKSGKWGFIDKTGKLVIPLKYDVARPFSDGLARVGIAGLGAGFIDKTGKEVISLMYDNAWDFNEGFAMVKKSGKCGFINKMGQEIIPLKYDDDDAWYDAYQWSFREGFAVVKKLEKFGFIDKTGKEVIPFTYDYNTSNFSGGLARVGKLGKWGFVDRTGKEVIPLMYDFVWDFSEGLAQVRKSGKNGFIDKTGKEITAFIYDWIDDFSEGLALVAKSDKRGFIDKTGKLVIPLIFQDASNFSEELAWVKLNNKWGIIRNPLHKKPKENLTATLRYYTPRENRYRIQPYILNQTQLPIEVEITTNTPVTRANCRTLINGKIAKSGETDLRKDGTSHQQYHYLYENILTFDKAGNHTVQVELIKDGVIIGRSRQLTVQYQPQKINLHLLTVGTSPPNLQYTEADARTIQQLFAHQPLYKKVYTEELIGEAATAANITIQLANFQQQYKASSKQITDRDLILLFFSSHGYASENGKFYIQAEGFSRLALQQTAIALDDIFEKLNTIPCKKILLIDACHSGTQDPSQLIAMKDNTSAATAKALKKLLRPQNGWTVITSSGDEQSWEHDRWQNGTFTEALQEALRQGKADTNHNGLISIQELANYLQWRVPQLNKSAGYPMQYPQVFSDLDGELEIYQY